MSIHQHSPYTFDPVQYEWFLTGQIEDYYDDPWTPAYEEKVRDFIDRFGLDEDGWTVDELLPTMPRETLGYYANGDPIDNPGEPFPDTEDLNYPTDDKLPPN